MLGPNWTKWGWIHRWTKSKYLQSCGSCVFSSTGTGHTTGPRFYDLHMASAWSQTCSNSSYHMPGIPSMRTKGLLPPLYIMMVFSVRTRPWINLCSPFKSQTSQGCTLSLLELSLSAEHKILHTREQHVDRFENSASSPHINHLTSLTVSFSCSRSYYSHPALLHAISAAFLRNLLYWTPMK